jgi:putative redox protein
MRFSFLNFISKSTNQFFFMAIEVYFPGGKKVDANINGFTIKTDQAVKSGGEGSEPEPFMLFLASLATCAGIYIKSFCDQRNIPADAIKIYQDQVYDPVARMIGTFKMRIVVPPDFPEKYDHALVQAASLCAVKKHLSDKIKYEIFVERE